MECVPFACQASSCLLRQLFTCHSTNHCVPQREALKAQLSELGSTFMSNTHSSGLRKAHVLCKLHSHQAVTQGNLCCGAKLNEHVLMTENLCGVWNFITNLRRRWISGNEHKDKCVYRSTRSILCVTCHVPLYALQCFFFVAFSSFECELLHICGFKPVVPV